MLAEYHNSIGGKPVRKAAGAKRSREGTSKTPQSGNKGKSRKVNDSASATPTVTETRVGKWKPPTGSWEEEIQAIDTVESDERGLHVYVQWNSGKKSRHPIEEIYKKCPQKVGGTIKDTRIDTKSENRCYTSMNSICTLHLI